MKIKPFLIAFYFLLFSISTAFAQNTYVPDDNFEQALIDLGYDSGALNDSVPTANIDTIRTLLISNRNINELLGISDFKELERLDCSHNRLNDLFLDNNTNLINLRCTGNYIHGLHLANNIALESVYCESNRIQYLNLNNSNLLKHLDCNNNNLGTINVRNLTALNYLDCSNNIITNLDISRCSKLTFLDCSSNNLYELNIRNGNNTLMSGSNLTTGMNASGNPNLGCIQVDNLNLTVEYSDWIKNGEANYSEDCSPQYQITYVPDNNFEQALIDKGYDFGDLDDSISTATILGITNLNVRNLNISDLTGIEEFSNLESLDCSMNQLTTINISKNITLRLLNCDDNKLTTINTNSNTSLVDLACNRNQLTELNLYYNSSLKYFFCKDNQISELDISNNHKLSLFDCRKNNITNIDASLNDDLVHLSCSDNHITTIDISKNTKLIALWCQFNNLNELNTDGALALVSLRCNNNKLTFIDFEDIFDNSNYTSFRSNFIYSPQDSIGNSIIDERLVNDSVVISIEEYIEGNTDKYQWFKNDTIIPNNTSSSLELINLKLSDTGRYNCHVTNTTVTDLTLVSRTITLKVNDVVDLGIPTTEYNALVDLYNSTNGENWINNTNWLDTTSSSVADWYGITVENSHITKIELPNNNLQEMIFENKVNLPYLEVIDIRGNLIDDANFQKLDSLESLEFVKIENNKFVFRHINQLINLTIYENFSDNFSYAPQAKIGSAQELTIDKGGLLEIEVPTFYLSNNDQFQWYKDGIAIQEENQSWYDKSMITLSDAGVYTLQVTNPAVSNLTLESQEIRISVTDIIGGVPRSEYEALIDLYNKLDGDNWTRNDNWLDTFQSQVNDWYGINTENGHVTQILLFDNNLAGVLPSSLANIKYLTHINFERNFIGELISGIKRQARAIPNELGTLNNLIQLSLGNNSIQFNDLEAILSWPNFSNISSFSYKYQNGLNNEINKLEDKGVLVKISLQNYFPAPSDQYQWIKNNNPIPGANDSVLVINNMDISDEGRYYCVLSNTKLPEVEITNYGTTLRVNATHGAGVPLIEYLALEKFFNTCNGNNWNVNTNWLDTTNYSVKDWTGVEVRNGHVYSLALDSNNVVGYIPSEFYNLQYLEVLSLVNNNISGEISPLIKQLILLRYLSLDQNSISGNIPSVIGEMETLLWLGLTHNELEGEIPSEVGNSLQLDGLNLSYNKLSGNIPETIGNLSNLRFLYLNNNSLSGTIPVSLSQLSKLRYLNLSNNELIGPIPNELEKLTNLYFFDIDNNLIGIISESEKSARNNNTYRQIPDVLAQLVDMDTFRLADNSLQFNDIEAIFSWDNFNDINEFIYTPQNAIGVSKTIATEEESSVTLSIVNYYPGASDLYQWYKNGIPIENGNEAELTFQSIRKDDSVVYNCVVTNSVATDLQLTSHNITLAVSDKQPTAGIPQNEYEALVNFYNRFSNNEWGDNWLDTINGTVGDWEGITIENGHVTAIDLSNLNIDGDIFEIFSAFDSLTWLNLSGNNLSGKFPTFNGSKSSAINSVSENGYNLSYLNIANNNFIFSDLEPVTDELLAIDTFIYTPQQLIGVAVDTSMYKYTNLTINIEEFSSGNSDSYTWFKNAELLKASNSVYLIENANLQDSGVYKLKVDNSVFPELTLESESYKLSVLIPVGINNFDINDFNLYPNPADKEVFIDTQNKAVKLKIMDIAGNVVYEHENFKTGRVNIEQYPKGIYLFRLEHRDLGVLNKKIVFK